MCSGRHQGKWRVQIIVKSELGGCRKLSRLFPTQREGKEFIRSLIREDGKAEALARKELTLGDWFRWLSVHDWPDTLDAKTIHGRLQRFGKFVEARFGKVPLTKIDPLKVKEFYAGMRFAEVGHATREAIRCDLVRVFNQAISPYRRVPMIWGNPFRLTMDSKPRRLAVALTPAEAKKALNSKNLDHHQQAMLGTFLLAGLRLSEQMALTVSQVNFEEGLIYIDTYDAGGRKTKQVRDGNPSTYSYDGINRLTGQQKAGAFATFTMDSVGNVLSKWHQGRQPITMIYDPASRITTIQDGPTLVTQTYDSNGNMILENRGGVLSTYSYDRENRLSVLNDVGALSTMTYAGNGLRRTKQAAGKLTTYIWDGTDYLSEQTS